MDRYETFGSNGRFPTRRSSGNAQTPNPQFPRLDQAMTYQHIPALIPPSFPPRAGPRETECGPHSLSISSENTYSHTVEPSLPSPNRQHPASTSVDSETHDQRSPATNMPQARFPSPGLNNTNSSSQLEPDNLPSPPLSRITDFADYPQSPYNYGTWTTQEDKTLLTAREQGHHWASIQQTHFPSKTANACRKRYERLMERRGIYDLDREKLERMAHEYMGMRKEIWSPLAARVGERWNVVEAQCMSAGLRTIQLHARAHARRQRQESRVTQRTATNPFQHSAEMGGGNDLHMAHGMPNGSGAQRAAVSNILAPVGFVPISPCTLDPASGGSYHHGNYHPPWVQQRGIINEEEEGGPDTPMAEVPTPPSASSGGVSEPGTNVEFMGYMSGQVSQKR